MTDRKEVLQGLEEYFKISLNKRENRKLDLLDQEEAMNKMKKCRAAVIDEVRVEILIVADRVEIKICWLC